MGCVDRGALTISQHQGSAVGIRESKSHSFKMSNEESVSFRHYSVFSKWAQTD